MGETLRARVKGGTLELLDKHLVVGIQDLGGAGLACATSETAARGGVGMDVDVSAVPLRERGMQPFEIMTSESQERMLAIITPSDLDAVLDVCAKWEVRATVVGRVVEPTRRADGRLGGMLRIRDGIDGDVLAEVPAPSLADEAPLYDRPRRRPASFDELRADDPTLDEPVDSLNGDLLDLLLDPVWVHRQYDSMLFLNTVVGPGRDAALLRLAGPGLPPSSRGIAITTDSNPRWCALDPRVGTALTLVEALGNLACVGAVARAVVNCLNFGNPEHPEVMWQLSEAIDGLAEACRAFDVPVIGGNVSLYNESGGSDIDPTPVLGVLGVVDRLVAPPPGWSWREGDSVVLVGARNAQGETSFPLGGSKWATRRGRRGGRTGGVDYTVARSTIGFVADEVASICAGVASDVTAVHDVSGGGLACALAEMAVVAGVGADVAGLLSPAECFSEFPGRFIIATSDPSAFLRRAAGAGVDHVALGSCRGQQLRIGAAIDLSVDELSRRRSAALTDALAASR